MLATAILDEVRRDVASFADPGTKVDITDRSLTWTRSRTQHSARLIRQADGFPTVSLSGREYSYQSFLASEALADLRDLAESILTQLQMPPVFIEAPARESASEANGHGIHAATNLLLKRTVDPGALPLSATRVLFVHGNAGTGKTSALTHVTRLQAERYLRGETTTLFLYLDAQGKGLAQLEDVMARTLQDLRAKFTYHSVASLTRRHCVIPIVDGFDELIGPSSAREAFANLAQFLAQLDCEGALIASSRSAFIDYKTLHERAAEIAAAEQLSYEILPIEVLAWPDKAVLQYCDTIQPPDDGAALQGRVRDLLKSRAGDLVRKPFFLAKICEILSQGGDVNEKEDLTRQVMEAALTREADKLSDQRGKQLLLPAQHRTLCESIADEMWAQGRPELDCDTVRLLAEITAEQFGLSPRDTKTLVDRSVAHGLLVAVGTADPQKRAFEHELFRFEFQAGSLARALHEQSDSCRDYLQRADIPVEVVERVPSYHPSAGETVGKSLERLSALVNAAPTNPYAPSNAGALVGVMIRDRTDLPKRLKLTSLYIRALDLGKCTLEEAQLSKCVLERVRLTDATFYKCAIQDTQFIGCVLGAKTRWDKSALTPTDFFGVIDASGQEEEEIYDPARIAAILRKEGAVLDDMEAQPAPDINAKVQARITLVERLLKHARSHYYLSPQDPWFRNNLSNDSNWQHVEGILRRHRLIEDVKLQKKGRPEVFMRLTAAPDVILRARSGPTTSAPLAVTFWRELATS